MTSTVDFDPSSNPDVHLLAAPDKFKGTATAAEAAAAMARGARSAGWTAAECPLADGGEGTLDAFGGPNRATLVSGPLGAPVLAGWRLADGLAVIEMARASGLGLLAGAANNDPIRASTRGSGELIAAAISAGARRIVVGVGGSATTDGGLGAVEALGGRPFADLGVEVEVACDVTTHFVEAAVVFGPQKGADEVAVAELTERLEHLADRYREDYGVELQGVARAGAAGGLAGGLFALGARLEGGFEVVARAVGLKARLRGADLVITGEGRLDRTSFGGKVVGGLALLARRLEVPIVAIAGDVDPAVARELEAVSMLARYGAERSFADTLSCLEDASRVIVGQWGAG